MVIKDAIARGARKQLRRAVGPLRRDVRRLRGTLRELETQVKALREMAAGWQDAQGTQRWQPGITDDEARAARLSPGLIRKLRQRLGLTQAAVGRLVGVSSTAVVQWEQGRATPAGRNRTALVGLRRLRRRQAKRLLASLADGAPPTRRTPAARRPAKARRRPRPARRP